MQVSVNDKICIEGRIVELSKGAWLAWVEVDEETDEISGAVTIKVGDQEFVGTVLRGKIPEGEGRWVGQIVGGAGGLDTMIDARFYNQASLRTVVQDALSTAGETLDAEETDASALSPVQPRWSRLRGKARLSLVTVANEIGGFWRVNRAGKVLFRKDETWETVTFDFDYIDADPSDGKLEIAPDTTPGARPGTTVDGYKVAEVRTTWNAREVRQVLTLAEDGVTRGDVAVFVAAIKQHTEAPINYSQWYPAKVVAQDADGTVHLMPDDARVRGTGLTKVPIRHGIPGLTVKVISGNYVRLFFENGDPKAPACALWEDGSSVQEVALAAPSVKVGPTTTPTQSAVLGELLTAYLDGINSALVTAFGTITPGSATTGGAPAASSFQAAVSGLEAAKQAFLSQVIKLG